MEEVRDGCGKKYREKERSMKDIYFVEETNKKTDRIHQFQESCTESRAKTGLID